jgi:acetylornithine deacetylase
MTSAPLTAIAMLDKLVAFPTVSSQSNLVLMAFVKDWLGELGVESTLVPSADGMKTNLYATIGPNVPGGIVLSGHTDVVPVEGQAWSTDPFKLTQKGDKLYGRGTCDMKGFDAICLSLVPQMLKAKLKRPVHIALSYDEETGCLGAPHMIDHMVQAGLAPSAVIVGEPTRLKVVTGHKGGVRLVTTARGKAVHSSRMDMGISAVHAVGKLIAWHVDVMAENAAKADPANPFEPPYTTLHCGMVSGGTAFNITAEEAKLWSEFRTIPTERDADYLSRYTAYIRDVLEPQMKAIAPEAGISFEMFSNTPGLRPEENGAAETFARRMTGDNGQHVVAYGTEGGLFQRAGWSTIVCGPGDIAQAHQPDEYIEISEMEAGTALISRMIAALAQ